MIIGIVVYVDSCDVLMVVFFDVEVLVKICEIGFVYFYLCFCGKLWLKGEILGYFLWVEELCVDCD